MDNYTVYDYRGPYPENALVWFRGHMYTENADGSCSKTYGSLPFTHRAEVTAVNPAEFEPPDSTRFNFHPTEAELATYKKPVIIRTKTTIGK